VLLQAANEAERSYAALCRRQDFEAADIPAKLRAGNAQ
jgi:hypothetical protein